MKKLFSLILITCSLMSSAQTGSFNSGGKTITYTSTAVTTNTVKYSDGTVLTITGSVAKAAVQKAYTTYINSLPASVTVIGTGSGSLDVGVLNGKSIKIKPGTYTGININKPVNSKIDATGVIIKNGSMDITGAQGLELYGLTITDFSYRGINIRELTTNLYFHDMTFRNIGNYTISYEYDGLYDGTDKTASMNWKFEHLTFENTGPGFMAGGGFDDKGGIHGLFKNFKFLNNTIKNCPSIGNVVWAGAFDNYEIAGNVIDHINYVYDPGSPNGIHNGIFMITGNGSFHDNRISNHQGNAIRAWGMSYGADVKDIWIYNNVVTRSWKYSAFEVQADKRIQDIVSKYPKSAKFTNAYIYNNTAGQLNLSKDWEGVMLDTYFTGGTISYYNNLGFDMVRTKGDITDMINSNGGNIIRNENNRYFPTATQAIADVTTFKSLVAGVGAQ